jgi:hypothetical protein
MMKTGMLSYQRFSRLRFLPISLWLLWLLVLPYVASAQTDLNQITISAQGRLQVLEVRVRQGDNVVAGDILAVMKQADGGKLTLRAGASGVLREWKPSPYLYFEDKESTGGARNPTPAHRVWKHRPLRLPRNQRSVAC